MSLWRRIYLERRRVILPLAIAAVVNIAVLILAVVPLGRSLTAAESTAQDATLSLASARQLERQARNAATSKERADRELQQFYTDVLPKGFAVASRTANRWLQQTARNAGLEYRGANFSWEAIRDSTLSRAYSTVTLRGRYQDIRQFLHVVETSPEFLVVERLDLTQSPASAGAAGLLEVALVVSTYFQTEEPPQ